MGYSAKQIPRCPFCGFPERLVEICILAGTSEGDLVLDLFMGSGTTACVAKRLGRRFLGIELIPQYVEMAMKRISSVAHQTALCSRP
ncbi:MAG: site-specific DNA-methyltransferase [Acidobacteria bacterium]|nr:MAG: site-specific DNA-methyltransferase [Acidobacteriota bacterium]